MKPSRDEVVRDTFRFLQERADEQGEDVDPSEDMYLLGDMDWSSLEMVVLANAAQQHYRQHFPFEELFANLAEREHNDLTVREWVDFVYQHLGRGAPLEPGELGLGFDPDALD